jgi:hypothetical protein
MSRPADKCEYVVHVFDAVDAANLINWPGPSVPTLGPILSLGGKDHVPQHHIADPVGPNRERSYACRAAIDRAVSAPRSPRR